MSILKVSWNLASTYAYFKEFYLNQETGDDNIFAVIADELDNVIEYPKELRKITDDDRQMMYAQEKMYEIIHVVLQALQETNTFEDFKLKLKVELSQIPNTKDSSGLLNNALLQYFAEST